ncbi:alpha-L-rhamnosidase family protein [Aspergillus flavus]|uniref:Alpha-L-rhamnosidase family protein n=1 Tax=Aspergillus flavus TaxID=5059 RepID=A0AB74CIH4_ASPFL|nr:alpha-L-rhamnosidase family protein [Aspergillus flavus]
MKARSADEGWSCTLGKWGIIVADGAFCWFYPDGGEAGTFPSRCDAGLRYCGYIDTWSRDYHMYYTNWSMDDVAGQLGWGNIWGFSGSDESEYIHQIMEIFPRGEPEHDSKLPPPNLATRLVARAAEPVKIQERLTPVSVVEPAPGTWVFDFDQNIVGFPLVNLPELPAGTTVKVAPAESLAANGTVDQASLGPGDPGTDLFNTYTTAGRPGGETWHPKFNYFGMQWVQVTGLPRGYKPSRNLITGLRVQADVPAASSFTSSSARLNRIHKMAWHSMASNIMSVFTDCPGREKLSYPADYTQPFGALARNFQFPAFLRTTAHHLVEGQSIANTSMAGNVALKTPVYD